MRAAMLCLVTAGAAVLNDPETLKNNPEDAPQFGKRKVMAPR